MKDIDELDALHAAATAGEWTWEATGEKDNTWCLGTEWEGEVVDFVAQSGSCERLADPAAIVALKNAWPSVSARLRTAEAEVERLRGLCAEARDMLRNMPWRRGGDALVTRLDRAALGEP